MATFTLKNFIGLMMIAGSAAFIGACSIAPKGLVTLEDASSNKEALDLDEQDTYTAVVPRVVVPVGDLADDAPNEYTVVKGDTLWGISGRFLKKPWKWPQLWSYNPQIANPHLIYPGDKLALEYVNGQPTLSLYRDGKLVGNAGNGGRARLSPHIRKESLDQAIPAISGEVIGPFLTEPRVVDAATVKNAPYVIASEGDQLAASLDQEIYVRGQVSRKQTTYGVYRLGNELVDPQTGRKLGQEVVHVANAKLLRIDDPSTLIITSNKRETIAGDFLLANNHAANPGQFTPRAPVFKNGDARIVSLFDAISQSGRGQVVVVNLGKGQKDQPGDVMAVESRGKKVIDKRGRSGIEEVTLPTVRTGVLMVFRVFENVSYALVMESTQPISVNDIVTGI